MHRVIKNSLFAIKKSFYKRRIEMKSRLAIIGLMICSVLAISANAQKGTTQIVLQDDRSADHLVIDITTGEYKFESCNAKVAISGAGKIDVSGCTVTLNDFSDTQRVVATVDLCAGEGKADIVLVNEFSERPNDNPIEFVLSDSNTRDSVFACGELKIQPK